MVEGSVGKTSRGRGFSVGGKRGGSTVDARREGAQRLAEGSEGGKRERGDWLRALWAGWEGAVIGCGLGAGTEGGLDLGLEVNLGEATRFEVKTAKSSAFGRRAPLKAH